MRSITLAIAGVLLSTGAYAVPIQVTYGDAPGEGFFDPTLGPARRGAFEFVLDLWGGMLAGNVPIVVEAAMDPLGGSSSSATLASTGPTTIHRDFPGAPLASTWYVSALANQLAGADLNGGAGDIRVTVNGSIDGSVLGAIDWYYGLDGNPGPHVDFVSVVLHELAHGLHFIDFVAPPGSAQCGAWLFDLPGIFDRNLLRSGAGGFPGLSQTSRCSALTSNQVFWSGSQVAAVVGGNGRLYAPSPYVDGSSISHWDPATHPGQLLGPFYSGPRHHVGLALQAMSDMGWSIVAAPPPPPPSTTLGFPGASNEAPAATVIAPFFEVDPTGATDTLLVVNNVSVAPVIVHREVWDVTGARVPGLSGNFTLTGGDTQPVSMRSLVEGSASVAEKTQLTRAGRWRGFVTFDAVTSATAFPPTDPSYPLAAANVLEGWAYFTRLTEGSSNGLAMIPIEQVGGGVASLLRGFHRPGDGREQIDADARTCADRLVRGSSCAGDANGVLDRIACRSLKSPDLGAETRVVVFAWRPGAPGGPGGGQLTVFDESGAVVTSGAVSLPDAVSVVAVPGVENGWVRLDSAIPADRQVYAFAFNSAKPADAALNWDAIFPCDLTP